MRWDSASCHARLSNTCFCKSKLSWNQLRFVCNSEGSGSSLSCLTWRALVASLAWCVSMDIQSGIKYGSGLRCT